MVLHRYSDTLVVDGVKYGLVTMLIRPRTELTRVHWTVNIRSVSSRLAARLHEIVTVATPECPPAYALVAEVREEDGFYVVSMVGRGQPPAGAMVERCA